MKKFLLLTFVASLFAVGSAFAHCGACGASEEAHDHSHAEKACCGSGGECCKDKSDCSKSDCAKKSCCGSDGKCCKSKSDCAKSDCTKKSCCGSDGKCCKDKAAKKACCGSDGKCCSDKKAEDETAIAAPPACCPASKAGKPA